MRDRFRQSIRQTYAQVRKKISSSYQQQRSSQICQRINGLKEYRYAKHIALYQSANGEVDLSLLWRAAPLQGKYCYFPALHDDLSLSFLPATPATNFIPNKYNIQEPDVTRDQAIPIDKLDLIFVPLVAFDKQGTRIGMGAGYYDRTLAQPSTKLLIGVAYEFQHIEFIQPQPWDVQLDLVITERNIYWIKK